MGEVYPAEDLRLRRRVALKVLPSSLAAEPRSLERFQREARAVATLNHPNIVPLHSVEEAEGLHFLVLEHVEGETLSNCGPMLPPGRDRDERKRRHRILPLGKAQKRMTTVGAGRTVVFSRRRTRFVVSL